MGAVYVSPGGGTIYPALQVGVHTDQIGINDLPANYPGFFSSGSFRNPGLANTYILTTAHDVSGLGVYTNLLQTDRDYTGGDVRSHKGGINSHVDVNNNDAAYNPLSGVSYNITAYTRVGSSGPSYGTCHGISSTMNVLNQGATNNEYAAFFGILLAGTYDVHLVGGGHWWFTDWALQGPIGVQPGILNGISLVTNNFYNGSPSLGASAGMSLQSVMRAGGGYETHCAGEVPAGTPATNYPMDIGYHASGSASGGTGDGYTNAFQAGGTVGVWTGTLGYGGDQGQVGRGFIVKAKNAGTSCARLGAFVSEGTGEGGGVVMGLDTADANRTSWWRSANSTNSIRGQIIPVSLVSAADDAAAASGGVPVGGLYQTSGTVKVRLS